MTLLAPYIAPGRYVRYDVHTMPKIVTATQARKDFFNLLDLASKPGHHVTISREGKPNTVMMSQDEFEGWIETMEIMSDPQLMKDIRDAEKDKRPGIPLEDVIKKLKL